MALGGRDRRVGILVDKHGGSMSGPTPSKSELRRLEHQLGDKIDALIAERVAALTDAQLRDIGGCGCCSGHDGDIESIRAALLTALQGASPLE
jgi:hypothetical protein